MKEFSLRLALWAALWTVLWTGAAEAAVLKIATISPEGSVWMEKMREGAARVKEKTEGRVKVEIFPSATLHGWSEGVDAIQGGVSDIRW